MKDKTTEELALETLNRQRDVPELTEWLHAILDGFTTVAECAALRTRVTQMIAARCKEIDAPRLEAEKLDEQVRRNKRHTDAWVTLTRRLKVGSMLYVSENTLMGNWGYAGVKYMVTKVDLGKEVVWVQRVQMRNESKGLPSTTSSWGVRPSDADAFQRTPCKSSGGALYESASKIFRF